MLFGDELIACQRMSHQNRVGFFRIQFTIGLISNRKRADLDATIEFQGHVFGKGYHITW